MIAERALAELATSPGAYVLSFILGALFGSFANVCIYRLPPSESHPRGRSVVSPGSHCFACQAAIRWYDNIPMLSYLWLRGRCRACKVRFSPRYLGVELLTSLLFLYAYYFAVTGPYAEGPILARLHWFGILAALVFTMVVIAFIDLDHKLILNKVSYPAVFFFYIAGLSLGFDWQRGLWGAGFGFGLIFVVSEGYYYATGREGLGLGDGKLLAVVGALYGWKAVLVCLFAGSFVGSIISITLLVLARRRASLGAASEPEEGASETPLRHVEVPFGPYLVAGILGYAFALPYLQQNFAGLLGTSML